MTKLHIKRLDDDADLPVRATELAAAFDLKACLWRPVTAYRLRQVSATQRHVSEETLSILCGTVTLKPGDRALIPTGLTMRPEAGYCVKLYPRSGLSTKRGLTLANCVGIGDEDYSGEYCVAIANNSGVAQSIADGERIAQMMVGRVEPVDLVECDELPEVVSGRSGGFGSTGA